ncbi:hypothetical protein, partial [Plantibacter flavus]
MSETMYPTRQRCKRCARKLGGPGVPVYFGLYCTPKCAGLAELHTDAAAAPRECKTERGGRWEFKRRYRSASELPNNLRDDVSVSTYPCSH